MLELVASVGSCFTEAARLDLTTLARLTPSRQRLVVNEPARPRKATHLALLLAIRPQLVLHQLTPAPTA